VRFIIWFSLQRDIFHPGVWVQKLYIGCSKVLHLRTQRNSQSRSWISADTGCWACNWARIRNRLRSPGIDSKESILKGWESIPGFLKGLQIRALGTICTVCDAPSVFYIVPIFLSVKYTRKRMDKFRVAPRSIPITQPSFREKSKTLASSENNKSIVPFNPVGQCCGSGAKGSVCVLGLLNPDTDPLVKGPDPDHSVIKQNSNKILDSYCLWLLYDLLSLKNDVNVPLKSNKQ
jgi:hypothetical protein